MASPLSNASVLGCLIAMIIIWRSCCTARESELLFLLLLLFNKTKVVALDQLLNRDERGGEVQ